MSIDALCQALPAYAGDLIANLRLTSDETVLTTQQKWGCFVASAYAVGQPDVVRNINIQAEGQGASNEAMTAARTAAAVIAMNNVYYRSMHLLSEPRYQALPVHLRMTSLANAGVDKVDFELWGLAVSAVNGCGWCLDAHESELRRHDVPALQVQAALRIAAVVTAVSRVLAAQSAALG
jgi:alkyl hydroperoxide reductase subunit D